MNLEDAMTLDGFDRELELAIGNLKRAFPWKKVVGDMRDGFFAGFVAEFLIRTYGVIDEAFWDEAFNNFLMRAQGQF